MKNLRHPALKIKEFKVIDNIFDKWITTDLYLNLIPIPTNSVQ